MWKQREKAKREREIGEREKKAEWKERKQYRSTFSFKDNIYAHRYLMVGIIQK
jgi:hypothetical protein